MVHIGSSPTPPKSGWIGAWENWVAGSAGILFNCCWVESKETGYILHTSIAGAIILALFSLYKQNERLHGQKEPAA